MELKPCPFCGGEASARELYDHTWDVYCHNCTAHMNELSTYEEAIEAWNRRADNG